MTENATAAAAATDPLSQIVETALEQFRQAAGEPDRDGALRALAAGLIDRLARVAPKPATAQPSQPAAPATRNGTTTPEPPDNPVEADQTKALLVALLEAVCRWSVAPRVPAKPNRGWIPSESAFDVVKALPIQARIVLQNLGRTAYVNLYNDYVSDPSSLNSLRSILQTRGQAADGATERRISDAFQTFVSQQVARGTERWPQFSSIDDVHNYVVKSLQNALIPDGDPRVVFPDDNNAIDGVDDSRSTTRAADEAAFAEVQRQVDQIIKSKSRYVQAIYELHVRHGWPFTTIADALHRDEVLAPENASDAVKERFKKARKQKSDAIRAVYLLLTGEIQRALSLPAGEARKRQP